jgi:hypothetical protein
MSNIVDLILNDANISDISDEIKKALHLKAAENIEALIPSVSSSLFGDEDEE